MEGERGRDRSKFHTRSDKLGKAEKIARAEKFERQVWSEKMEHQEKSRMRIMNPLEAHMLSKISAGVDTMMLSGKHKEYMLEKVREGMCDGRV